MNNLRRKYRCWRKGHIWVLETDFQHYLATLLMASVGAKNPTEFPTHVEKEEKGYRVYAFVCTCCKKIRNATAEEVAAAKEAVYQKLDDEWEKDPSVSRYKVRSDVYDFYEETWEKDPFTTYSVGGTSLRFVLHFGYEWARGRDR